MKFTFADARLAFPDIFEPNKDGKFAAAFIFPTDHKSIALLKKLIDEVGAAKWGAKWATLRKELTANDNMLIHNGDAKASYVGYEGNLFFNANNTVRPLVIDRDKTPLVAADGKPYSGCHVNVIIDVWAQDNQYGKKINAQLQGIQFLRDGEAFSGGGVAADQSDFEEITEGADAEDLV
ncbi:ssDNA-binding protein [Pseudomonas sp.]|uniref:ssDNA-binding protein n=1 Tax=Pseudomonas sp. TaxID=306 RepID=UPI003FD6D2AC